MAQPAGAFVETFPEFDEFRLELPLRGRDYAIWPDERQTHAQWVIGHPLELRPCRWDFLDMSCKRHELTIKPHYDKSTWDTFWIDTGGSVRANGLGRLFPWTMGQQAKLLNGVISVLGEVAKAIRTRDPELAATVDRVAEILAGVVDRIVQMMGPVALEGPPAPLDPGQQTGLRNRLAARFWRWKLTERRCRRGGAFRPPEHRGAC
jgi:hypothetical protein